MEWFASRKEAGIKDKIFRNDHMSLLALSRYCVMDVPKNIAGADLTCKIVTTASAHLCLLIFDVLYIVWMIARGQI